MIVKSGSHNLGFRVTLHIYYRILEVISFINKKTKVYS